MWLRQCSRAPTTDRERTQRRLTRVAGLLRIERPHEQACAESGARSAGPVEDRVRATGPPWRSRRAPTSADRSCSRGDRGRGRRCGRSTGPIPGYSRHAQRGVARRRSAVAGDDQTRVVIVADQPERHARLRQPRNRVRPPERHDHVASVRRAGDQAGADAVQSRQQAGSAVQGQRPPPTATSGSQSSTRSPPPTARH